MKIKQRLMKEKKKKIKNTFRKYKYKKKQTEINSTKNFFEKEINDEQYNIFTKEFDLSVNAKNLLKVS